MTTMVCFEAAGARYCVPLASTRSVRTVADLVALPDPARDVVGIIDGDPPLTVISPLGAGRGHILVMETPHRSFGLVVDAVTGLKPVDEALIRRAPDGQGRPLVSGTLDSDEGLIFVADPDALAGRL